MGCLRASFLAVAFGVSPAAFSQDVWSEYLRRIPPPTTQAAPSRAISGPKRTHDCAALARAQPDQRSYYTSAIFNLASAYRALGYREITAGAAAGNAALFNWANPCGPSFFGFLAAALISRLDYARSLSTRQDIAIATLSEHGVTGNYADRPENGSATIFAGDARHRLRLAFMFEAAFASGFPYRAPSIGVQVDPARLSDLSQRDRAFTYGNGLNANQTMAQLAATRISAHGDHVVNAISYLTNRGSLLLENIGSRRESGDLHTYVSLMNAAGHSDIAADDINHLAAIALLASGSPYAYARAVIEFMRSGQKRVRPIGFRVGFMRFDWPEFTVFLNKPGVSLETRLLGDMPFLHWQLALERVLYGDRDRFEVEFALHAHDTLQIPVVPAFELRISESLAALATASVQIPIARGFSLYGGVSTQFGDESKTLRGARELGNASSAFSLGVVYRR